MNQLVPLESKPFEHRRAPVELRCRNLMVRVGVPLTHPQTRIPLTT
jgi:hypothetical protein